VTNHPGASPDPSYVGSDHPGASCGPGHLGTNHAGALEAKVGNSGRDRECRHGWRPEWGGAGLEVEVTLTLAFLRVFEMLVDMLDAEVGHVRKRCCRVD
jgi:hypothetical protein